MISARELLKNEPLDPMNRYLGQVTDNEDPDEGYKLRIRIYPFFADVDDGDLLWCRPFYLKADTVPEIPKVGDWVWCIFREFPLKPYWLTKHLVSEQGDYSYIRTNAIGAISKVNSGSQHSLSSLTYPNYEILQRGSLYLVFNTEDDEFVILDDSRDIVFSITPNGVELRKGQTQLYLDGTEIKAIFGNTEISVGALIGIETSSESLKSLLSDLVTAISNIVTLHPSGTLDPGSKANLTTIRSRISSLLE
jgi:hypothetical protein